MAEHSDVALRRHSKAGIASCVVALADAAIWTVISLCGPTVLPDAMEIVAGALVLALPVAGVALGILGLLRRRGHLAMARVGLVLNVIGFALAGAGGSVLDLLDFL